MDISRLSRGERLVAAAGGALLVLSVLPVWSKYETIFGTGHGSAWDASISIFGKLGLLLVLAAVVPAGMRAAGKHVDLPVSLAQAYLAAGGIATVLLLVAVLVGPTGSEFSGPGLEVSRGPALLLSPLFAAAITYGGYLEKGDGENTTGPAGPSQAPPAPPAPPA